MRRIEGKSIARSINVQTRSRVTSLIEAGTTPTLAVVVPTNDEATAWYVRSIARTAGRLAIDCRVETIADATHDAIVTRLDALSRDPEVHGIICQTPLPAGVALHDVAAHIAPEKDVDGANPDSLGRLVAGSPAFAPATAAAVVEILRREDSAIQGSEVVVIGRSTVVGKPAALLLLAESATVTICHSRTQDLAKVCRRADVLVSAVGRARFVTEAHVKPGAIVVDVGTNPMPDGSLAGDVDADTVSSVAAALTPVPGGVGPVTTALLLRHVLEAATAGR